MPNILGEVELDAAFMEGATRRVGAVAAVKGYRHPISIARQVMERLPHVFLAGDGAMRFAEEIKAERANLLTDESLALWRERINIAAPGVGSVASLPDLIGFTRQVISMHTDTLKKEIESHDTMNVIVRDERGHIFVAVTTSGIAWKYPGRVGDSPIIGAGTYADNRCCAVSATGHGEYFIRTAVAHDIYARMAYGGATLQAAADAVVMDRLAKMGGEGGIIAVGARGEVVMSFNSEGMFRGSRTSEGRREVAIYRDH
jgi:beta-aspartyl-peptidase (threonine type)